VVVTVKMEPPDGAGEGEGLGEGRGDGAGDGLGEGAGEGDGDAGAGDGEGEGLDAGATYSTAPRSTEAPTTRALRRMSISSPPVLSPLSTAGLAADDGAQKLLTGTAMGCVSASCTSWGSASIVPVAHRPVAGHPFVSV
jgi:hypothetical protein